MQRRRIGRSSLVVSEICLGTMTFGSTCEESQAFRIMDMAHEAGIDFLDTAEIYPVPPEASYVHRTEEIVGKWLRTKSRESLLIATKFCGPGHGWFVPPVRQGRTAVDRYHIRQAIEGSLRRLQTDYIDLYQSHWPDHDFSYDLTLDALSELIEEGKVRYIGVSNENAWGLMKSAATAEQGNWPRYESVQNNFSILNRRFEDEMAEICRRERISLLPYSPIGGGVLTGKYNVPEPPRNARFSHYLREGGERQKIMAKRFVNEKSLATTAAILELARELGVTSAALAVAWSKQHDFVASTIIGVNTPEQLEQILPAADLILERETLQRIDEICRQYPYPLG
jgi:aryl-alcohol dehydrogenase-like predicted oxidoreductase